MQVFRHDYKMIRGARGCVAADGAGDEGHESAAAMFFRCFRRLVPGCRCAMW